MTRVAVIDSGVANLASVSSALRALGAEAVVTQDAAVVAAATHVVLPGVGTFAAGMEALRRHALDAAVRDACAQGKPLLAVCLGFQLLGAGSAESPNVEGIGVIPGRFVPFPPTARIPHLGWNRVEPAPGCAVLAPGHAAFANSYCLSAPPPGWRAAWTTHETRFVAALERDRTVACQFHPELSGAYGLALIDRWLRGAGVPPAAGAPERSGRVLPRIVPCLDVRHGRVVKGVNFQQLRDAGDPAEQAARYERQGADEIVVLDVAASAESQSTQLEVVRAVRSRVHVPVTVGGGVRTVDDARRLLAAGADKVSVNTAAVADPALLTDMARAFGSQCVVLAIDARRADAGWEVLVVGGRASGGRDAVAWGREGVARGAGEILLTSWDRDGTRRGCDLRLVASMRNAVGVPVIASGGIGTREDVAEAFGAGADAVLAASVFHDGQETVAGIKDFLAQQGIATRP